MQCERLKNLAKSWYVSVQEETMAPARMVQFIKQHVASCSICQEDPGLQDEIAKITEVILPESKIPKAVRIKQEQEEAAYEEEEHEEEKDVAEETTSEDDFGDEEDNEEPLSPDEQEV